MNNATNGVKSSKTNRKAGLILMFVIIFCIGSSVTIACVIWFGPGKIHYNKRMYTYYNKSLPLEEVYSTVDAKNTKYPAVDYNETTKEPMAASHFNNPNWGDERQFARMAPALDGLTPGDAVAQIILRPDTMYSICEYLSNSSGPDEKLENVKLNLNFPLKIEAGTYEPLYAYITSDNDPYPERICFIVMYAEDDMYLTASETSVCTKVSDPDVTHVIYANTKTGIMINDLKPRATVEITWPKDAEIRGGNDNAWFLTYSLSTSSKDLYNLPSTAAKLKQIYRSALIMLALALASVAVCIATKYVNDHEIKK